jgi:hypothetical protein
MGPLKGNRRARPTLDGPGSEEGFGKHPADDGRFFDVPGRTAIVGGQWVSAADRLARRRSLGPSRDSDRRQP